MSKSITTDLCKKIVFNIGIKFGISPKIIATQLLSEEDKQDMLSGDLSIEALECAVKTWMNVGMPNYAHGYIDLGKGHEK